LADDAFQALSRRLGGDAPDGLRRLEDRHLRDLQQAVADAHHRQTAALNAAGDRALGMVPRLLRGPIRRVVG
jgi:hypothetical protein